jgi:osmotically-inducible protein OsmY
MSHTGRVHGPREDHEIEQDVRAELALEQSSTDRQRFVGVSVECGVVRLTGSAGSYAQKRAFERAAGRVVGVTDVRDHVDVRPADDVRRADRGLERAARHALEWDARVPEGITVDVTDGVLQLRGAVARFAEREAAEEAVRNLIGLRDLVNEIRVAPAPPLPEPADLARVVAEVIRRRFGFDSGYFSIAIADGVVTVSGIVPRFANLDEIERAVRSIPGVTRIDNHLLVAS